MPKVTLSGASAARAVVALGNPDRADDGVGLAVLKGLRPPEGVEIFAAAKTGLDLALALLPYKKVLLVDALPFIPPGEVELFPLRDLRFGEDEARFSHEIGLSRAFAVLAHAGFSVPEVWVLGIGVPRSLPFRRGLSPKVAKSIPKAKEVVEKWLAS